MSEIVFVFNAPSLSFNKSDLYKNEFINSNLHPFVKAISDSFFLSNDFRKNHTAYFLTSIEGKPYQIIFKGNELRFLGPSFFSAAHLLLRAKNHILYPDSKKGKLTPGLSVQKQDIEGICEKYPNGKYFLIDSSEITENYSKLTQKSDTMIFLFGFSDKEILDKEYEKIFLNDLEIDEQVIILNYQLESVK